MPQDNTIKIKVYTIECISCISAFKNVLKRHSGVNSVEALPMTNEIIIRYDPSLTEENEIKDAVLKVAAKAGLNGKIAFINT